MRFWLKINWLPFLRVRLQSGLQIGYFGLEHVYLNQRVLSQTLGFNEFLFQNFKLLLLFIRSAHNSH